MAYEPTSWKTGDTVTASKLNKMEQGIAGGGGMAVPYVLVDEEDISGRVVGVTAGEIWGAVTAGLSVIFVLQDEDYTTASALINAELSQYAEHLYSFDASYIGSFAADAANEVPYMPMVK